MEAVINVGGELITRKLRSKPVALENGGYTAFVSLNGKRTKITKAKRKRQWQVA